MRTTQEVSKRYLVIGITFTVGLAIGVLSVIAIQNLSPQNEQAAQGASQRGGPLSPTTSADGSLTDVSGEIRKVLEILNQSSVFDQQSAIYASLSTATAQELKDLWIQSHEIERESHRETLQDAIIRKLTTIDPQEALRYIEDVSKFQTDALLQSIFSEWSVSQLDDAIDAATKLSSPGQRVALQAIHETRDDLSDSERRTIARQLNGESTFLKLVSDSKASLSIAEPTESWDILLSDDVDDALQTESLLIVAEAWREQVGFKVLSNIYQADIEDARVKRQLVGSIAQADLASALDYTRGLSEEEQRYLCRIIAIEWANTDPQSALAAVATFEPASLASRLENTVAITWARTKPIEVIENIESISEELRINTLESAFWQVATKDPLEAIGMISAAENFVGNTSTIVKQIVYVWSNQNPEAAAEWVVNQYDQDDPIRRQLLESVLSEFASVDPEKAFEFAIAQPVPNEGPGQEYLVMGVITRENNIELAMKLLPRVHENAKGYAYALVAAAMVHDQRTKEALALGTELNESEQVSFYRQVYREWSDANPKNLLESLESLATAAHKSQAAMQLILKNRFEPVLNDEQIDHARTLLSSDHAARLKRIEEQ